MFAPDLFPVHVGFVFVVGTLFGSFFNVCIYRIPTGQALSVPGSYCYTCGRHVRWYDNLPVISYLLLGGRCRVCRSPFSARYALIELLTGCLFLAVFWSVGFCWALPTYLVFTGLLLIATFTDFDHWIIPDRISWGGALLGLVLALLLAFLPPVEVDKWIVAHAGPAPGDRWWGPAANGAVGAAAGASLLWTIGFVGSILFRKPAMGLGDSKLLCMIGAFCGWKVAVLCIFLASFSGSFYGLAMIFWSKLERRRVAKKSPSENAVRTVEEIQAILDDDSQEARRRGWLFSVREKAALTRLLSEPKDAPHKVHHLEFGPHLALAAWILMLFEKPVMEKITEYFTFY